MSHPAPLDRPALYLRGAASLRWGAGQLALLVFLGFALFYLAMLSANLSITHDSPGYALRILRRQPELHPNHLLYEPVLAGLVRLLAWAGLPATPYAIEAAGALAGASALAASFLTLNRHMGLPRPLALAATAGAGLSFGVWYYSVAIEIYIFPLAFLSWSFCLLSAPRPGAARVAAAAALQSAAILFHQTAILFSLVPVLVLLGERGATPARRAGLLALYVGLGAVLVGGAYLAATAVLGRADSLAAFWTWLLGYGTKQDYWSPLGPKALLLAAIGLGRAILGSHFLFALPGTAERMQAAFPTNSIADEVHLVGDLAGVAAQLLLGLAVAWAPAAAVLAALALAGLLRRGGGVRPAPLLPLFAWLLPYAAFFTAWDAANVDFWVVQVVLGWMLLAVGLSRRFPARHAATMLGGLAAGLCVLNGAGSIRPAADPGRDYYRVKAESLTAPMASGGLLVVADGWPDAMHLRLHADRFDLLALSEVRAQPPEAVADRMRRALGAGQPVYLWPDVLEPRPDSLASYGPDFRESLLDLRRRICGSAPLPGGLGLAAHRLECLR